MKNSQSGYRTLVVHPSAGAILLSPIQVQQTSQPFIRAHNEPLSVAAMRVNNPDCSPV
jgi:hypothetical protein